MFNAKLVFTVSIVAMMAVNSVLADSATGDAVGTAHNVFSTYTPTDSDGSKPGIAGVTYVNRAVNAAGNAATKAEQHAASAGASALSAADSAAAANTAAVNAAASAKNANDAIAGLDLNAVGADGSYIKTISQSNGKVSATKEAADTTPTSGSKKMVTSGGVYTALGKKVNISQGTGNAGKGLVVDATSGNLTLVDVATQAEFDVLNTSNTNVSADVTTLKSDVSNLKTGVSELESEKQDVISDLTTIRSGAAAGSTALQKADIATGTSNGTISVDGSNVAVKGLGSAAYKASSTFATAAQGAKADGAVQTNQGTENEGMGLVVDTSGKLTLTDVATQAELNAVSTTAGNAVVANPAITGGTGTKITYDSKGLVTGSTSLTASDIPTLSSSKISNLGTINATNMGTSATTVVAAIKEVAGEAAAAQATADKAVVANAAITAGTGTKITYDSKGLVTGSTSLAASDIPTLSSSKISGLGTISATNMGTSATTVVAAIKEVAGEAAAAQATADKAVQTNQGTGNAGKGLVVDGTSGDLTLIDVATQAELNALTTANTNVSADVTTLKSDVSGLKTAVLELDSEKQDAIADLEDIRNGATAGSTAVQTNQTTTNANKIMITNASGSVTPVGITASGSGNVVSAVSVENGKLTVTKGKTLGTSALTIKNGATSETIATFGANATAAVTATIPAASSSVAGLAKYGVIPSGSETSTTYATIWVE